MSTQNSSIRKIGNYRINERLKKFTFEHASRIWHDDSWDCDCCSCYDDDHLSDDIYEWEYEYVQSRQHLFYENLNSLKSVFTSQYIENLKLTQSARIDCLKVYLEISHNDLVDGYNNHFFQNTFDENNKYGMKIYASITYADFDLSKIKFLDIHIEPSFEMAEVDLYQPYFKFNIYFMQNMEINSKNIKQIYRRINYVDMPLWCETSEEKFMYYFLSNKKYNKAMESFDIKDVIKNLEVFEVFKMYIN